MADSRLEQSPRLSMVDAQRASLQGDLTLMSVVPLVAQGEALIDQAQNGVWCLDLQGVQRVSSAAVALLLDWLRYANSAHVQLQLQHIPDEMRPIIAVSDLVSVFAELELVE